jgi:hypothetical protein
MSYANAITCPSSLPILGVRSNESASNATGLNHLYVVALHVLLVYAKNVTTHAQLMMLLQLIPPIMSLMMEMFPKTMMKLIMMVIKVTMMMMNLMDLTILTMMELLMMTV